MTDRSTLLKSLLLSCALAGGCECLPASQIACNVTAGSMCPDNYVCSSTEGAGFCEPYVDAGTRLDAGVDGGAIDGGTEAGFPPDAGLDAGSAQDAGGDAGPESDAGPDAGTDAGPEPDAGVDAGPELDAGPGSDGGADAGIVIVVDAGVSSDGGADAGQADAGSGDAGETDAGPGDAGQLDAGTVDGGAVDAGPVDAGPVDAGIDAGTDAGTDDAGTDDAGPPPPAPDTSPDGGVVYTRIPWGVDGGLPSFTVTGAAGTASGDAYIVAYDGPSPTANQISPVTPVADDGSFSLILSGGDHTLVYLVGENSAQTLMSSAAQIHNVLWTATFGGKVPGNTTTNPHVLYEATDFLISGEGLTGDGGTTAVDVQQGPLSQEAEFLSEPPADTGGYAGVIAAGDGNTIGFDSLLGVWYDRTPGGSVQAPPLIQSAMAYDAARGRTVLFGGSTGTVSNQTYEWDGHVWSNVTPSSGSLPPARVAHAMTYDAACGCTLLFGGQSSSGQPLGDTWEWDGGQWTQLQSTANPSARLGHTMSYDAVRGVVVMLGGFVNGSANAETWEWSAGQWTQVMPTASPPARCFSAMDFDSFRGKTVLYGGEPCTGNMSSQSPDKDLWEWDGSTWTNPQVSGGPSTGLSGHGMAYSVQHQKSVIFGGSTSATGTLSSTVWTWNGTTWSSASTGGPTARAWNSMAYDSSRDQVLTFGGRDVTQTLLSDTWAWSQSSTVPSSWVNTTPGTASPTARQNHAMVFDSTNDVAVLFGGSDSSGLRNDTWLWNGYSWANPDPATIPTARQGQAMAFEGSGVTLMVGGDESSGVVNDTWEWNGSDWVSQTPSVLAEAPTVQKAGAAYDSVHAETVLFGGSNSSSGSGGAQSETDLWNGSGWASETLLPSAPSARALPAMTYYPVTSSSGYTLLFGGFTTSWQTDTWEWTGSSWAVQTTATTPTLGNEGALVFDSSRLEPLLFGGTSSPETWVWTQSDWVQLNTATSPSGRTGFAMAYDSNRKTTVLFGGIDGSTLEGDTWELPTNSARRAAAIAEFSFGAANTQLNAVIQQMTFTAFVNGVGNAFSETPPGSRTDGAVLAVWDATGGGWKELASNTAASPTAISYTTTTGAEAQGYLLQEPDTIDLAMFPTDPLANGNMPATVNVDYVQVTVEYVQP